MTHCYLDWHETRDHPYLGSGTDPARTGYYDFKATPELIPIVLEDFVGTPPATAFYELLKWLNGPGVLFESNDCAFSPMHANVSPNYSRPLEASGRLMILYRDLVFNVLPDMRTLLNVTVEDSLKEADPTLRWGAVRISHCPTKFRHLILDGTFAEGVQLSLNFWAWGSNESDLYDNLVRVFKGMQVGLNWANTLITTFIRGNEDLLDLQAAQADLFKKIFSITTARQGRYKSRHKVLSHLRRLSETHLLCGRSMLNQALIGCGNVPSISADGLHLCKPCERKFHDELRQFLAEMGISLRDWLSFLEKHPIPEDDVLVSDPNSNVLSIENSSHLRKRVSSSALGFGKS